MVLFLCFKIYMNDNVLPLFIEFISFIFEIYHLNRNRSKSFVFYCVITLEFMNSQVMVFEVVFNFLLL